MDTYSENQERHVLIVNTGERRAYALEAAAYSIGRDGTNAIILDFDTVSREHALLLRVPNPMTKRYEYRLIDGNAEGKASANGVYVNGEAVKSQTLKNGDTVEFGQHVKAAYLTLSMGEAEFVSYLESISYQSLKRELVDSKATMVGGTGFDEMFLDTPTQMANDAAKDTNSQAIRHKNSKWQKTMHDSEKFAKEFKQLRDSYGLKNSPFRLWMAIAAGTVTVAIAAGVVLMLNQNKAQQPEPTSAYPAVSLT